MGECLSKSIFPDVSTSATYSFQTASLRMCAHQDGNLIQRNVG